MGRGISVLLMVAGIALFGVITAAIAAHFVEDDSQHDGREQALKEIAIQLASIEDQLKALTVTHAPAGEVQP